MARPGSFAEAAERGIYLMCVCSRCRRQSRVAARTICERGFGNVQLVGSQERFRCEGCGRRGVSFTIHGYWVGVAGQPEDWAETVGERMGGSGSESPPASGADGALDRNAR